MRRRATRSASWKSGYVWFVVGVAMALGACDALDPVGPSLLCSGRFPISELCPQCQTERVAPECPQCQAGSTDMSRCDEPMTSVGGAGTGADVIRGPASGTGGVSGASIVMAGASAPGSAAGSHAGASGGADQVGGSGSAGMSPPPGQCLANADCHDPALPACRVTDHMCVACVTKTDCKQPAAPACDTNTNRCVACVADTDCPAGAACSPQFECVQCVKDAQCKQQPLTTCNSAYKCVDCVTDANRGCEDSPQRPACFVDACVECVTNGDCGNATQGKKPVCVTGSHVCVECVAVADCAATPSKPVCDTTNTCVQCAIDDDCKQPGAASCNANSCGACTADAQCAHLRGTGRCHQDSGTCVRCLSDSDCMGGTCVLSKHTCSATPKLSVATCNACETTTQCQGSPSTHACVTLSRNSTSGNYCLAIASGSSCTKPYQLVSNMTSVDDVAVNVCAPPSLASCPAVLAALSGANCQREASICADGECHPGELSGDSYYCTYNCTRSEECVPSAACVGGQCRQTTGN